MDKKYVVYQHVTPDGLYYFGQTNNIKRRWRNNGAGYKKTSLYPYIERYGWENIQHIVLFRDQTRENALFIENFLIETAREDGVCINQRRSGLVSKEKGYKQRKYKQYYEDNKDKIQERQKQYRKQNKDKIKQTSKQYRKQNKDKIKQYYEDNKDKKKQYYQTNREKKLEYQRQYRQKKKLEKQLKEEVETALF